MFIGRFWLGNRLNRLVRMLTRLKIPFPPSWRLRPGLCSLNCFDTSLSKIQKEPCFASGLYIYRAQNNGRRVTNYIEN